MPSNILRKGQQKHHKLIEKVQRKIPNMTVEDDNSFVNFISLAESVALAPKGGFWITWIEFSEFEVDNFILLADELLFATLLFWCSS